MLRFPLLPQLSMDSTSYIEKNYKNYRLTDFYQYFGFANKDSGEAEFRAAVGGIILSDKWQMFAQIRKRNQRSKFSVCTPKISTHFRYWPVLKDLWECRCPKVLEGTSRGWRSRGGSKDQSSVQVVYLPRFMHWEGIILELLKIQALIHTRRREGHNKQNENPEMTRSGKGNSLQDWVINMNHRERKIMITRRPWDLLMMTKKKRARWVYNYSLQLYALFVYSQRILCWQRLDRRDALQWQNNFKLLPFEDKLQCLCMEL